METAIENKAKLRRNRCSYPTYEEWKLYLIQYALEQLGNSSYPTYEEWKLNITSISASYLFSSYPTYEEWKQVAATRKR